MEPQSAEWVAMKDLASSKTEEDESVLVVLKTYEDYVVIDTLEEDVRKFTSALKDLKALLARMSRSWT